MPSLPPMPSRQNPLLLVPELRVATPEPADDGDIEDGDTDDGNVAAALPPTFADFAGQIGAGTFADLIEAAAAFLICTEGDDSFTRPDLMRLVSTLPGRRGGSPDDQMRVFGILLRDGRFQRAGSGTFGLPPDAPVLARARRLLA